MKEKTIKTFATVAMLLLIGSAARAVEIKAGRYSVELKPDRTLSIRIGGRELYALKSVETVLFKPDVTMQFGFFKLKKNGAKAGALEFAMDAGGVTLERGPERAGSVNFIETDEGNLSVTVSVKDPAASANAVRMKFACAADDRFWGFGEQYNYIDLRGQTVPIWVQEQGVGRVKNSTFPPMGSFTDSYFPMPYFMDPAKGKGFLVTNPEYSVFNLCNKAADTWDVEVWNNAKVTFIVLPGPKPADVVSQLTAEAGRPKATPPDWTMGGVWLASQRGPEMIDKRVETARKAGIPLSAVWVQDWLGERHFGIGNYGVKHHWTWDPALYPNLAEQIAALRAKGVRFLGYFNPFIVEDYDQFAEAKEKGYMVKKRNGEPYVVQIITFKGGMLDVTNPDAVEWFKGFARKATDMGMSGWMCDFGEWLPYDAVLYDGTTGAALHNLYTTRWHRINREVLNEKYPDGDYALLTRSGYTFEQNVAQFVWAGDQEQDWKDEDGLPTVVTAALNIGLSGVPYFTTDIAGFSGGPSSKELFMRWTELGAFMPAMRTHDGLKKMENHRFDSDAETLAHFSKMAQIHAALLPYLKQVAGEAVGAGLPMIRHTVLVDPDWDKSLAANRQWLLGSDLLFAPALAQGAGSVEVSFPQGDWEHLLTGEKFKGRQTAIVAAPVGTPAVFVRSGKLDDVARAARAVYEK